MAEYTKDEALAFIEAIRLGLSGKVGFKWLVERLSLLSAYIESVAEENERLQAFLDWSGSRDGYESYCSSARPGGGSARGSVVDGME
jgi:hypothetical protein